MHQFLTLDEQFASMTSSQRSKLSLGSRGPRKDEKQKKIDTFFVVPKKSVKTEDSEEEEVVAVPSKQTEVETVDLSSDDDDEEASFMSGCKPITSKRPSPSNW